MTLEQVQLLGTLFIFLYRPVRYLLLQLKSRYGCGRSRFPVVIYVHCLFIRIRYFDLVLLYILFITFGLVVLPI